MDVSPFPFHGPLDPGQVSGRDDLIADLVERVSARRVTALLGPRRFGKTSVLGRVAEDAEQGGATVVSVDLYEVSSMADIAVRLDEALATARGPGLAQLRHLAASAEINLGLVKLSFARRSADQPDPVAVVHVLLDALVALGRRDPTLLILDEFPGIDRVDGAAGLLRTKLQAHVQQIGLVFAGSHTSLMRAMFSDVERPFYGQADLVEIDPLTGPAVARLVDTGFNFTGRDPGSIAAHIQQFAEGHPQRTMQLADAAWRHAVPGDRYSDELWAQALADVRAQTEPAHESMFSRSSASDQKALRLIANGEPLFGSAASFVDLSAGAGQSSRDRLIDFGEITRVGKRWRLVDPLYADWIRRRFPM
jgi:hypothetical protein